jgi:ribosome-binding factor A
MQPKRRPQRLALQIQHEVSLILSRDMRDHRVGFVTVTGVDMSPDLRYARIFVSAMGSEREKDLALETLNHAAGWIRRELGQRIRIKFLPEIEFRADTSQQYGERIDQLLDDLKEQ